MTGKSLFMWLAELFLLSLTFFMVALVLVPQLDQLGVFYLKLLLGVLPFAILYLLVFFYFDLYTPEFYPVSWKMLVRLGLATGVTTIFLVGIYHPGMLMGAPLPKSCDMSSTNYWCCVLLLNALIAPLALLAWRGVFTSWLSYEFPEQRVIILGSGDLATKIGRELYRRKDDGLNLVGFVDDDPEKFGKSVLVPGIIGGYGDIETLVNSHKVDKIVVALADRRAKLPMSALLDCKLRGVSIMEGETFQERLTGQIPLEQLKPSWMVFSDGFKSLKSRKIIKRMIDLTASSIGLILASPLMLVTVLIIKFESRGPVTFSQMRAGEHGKEFNLYKFRSMRDDAEGKSGPVWAKQNDDRVTPFGRFMRKTRIDELPQLINVIKGDMSFVGPRPERQFFVDQLKEVIPYYNVRLVVKPGLTGWAQVKYPYGASIQDALEKLQFDIYYIKNMSPLFDLFIIFSTIKVVLKGSGAR